ncbi:histone-lysine N-methyltransferase [Strigomonas culicis]|uniref:Histone-lysine N-methyltransferase, H3 lysine-79 specific n=2 Tax=Strigomonas culicis TaxID=28005 RepID=S9UPX9_9TRYP|nr:histone-lysine N-methyltransferase [Strigomonas culicis]EPY30844.1 histone-lysine N-methyltransferase [Strigomonas culicis]|eukprot:EPY23856.1 histone-lysine N-methyltransferase [Strigomonas culicis]
MKAKRTRTASISHGKQISQFLSSNAAQPCKVFKTDAATIHQVEEGDGSPQHPFRLPLRTVPNNSGCYHCQDDKCSCVFFTDLLDETYKNIAKKRVVEVTRSRSLCAKSLLPTFVSRIIKIMNITKDDTFYDFGCGNGSILFQIAHSTGASCIGIEISEQNADVAREAHAYLTAKLKDQSASHFPSIKIVTDDITKYLAAEPLKEHAKGKNLILLSNLLFPKPLTQFIAENLRKAPLGTQILCFDDLYPHGRTLAKIRDPEAFELFEMRDYVWQKESVEWCGAEGPFYVHTRK